MRYEYLASLRRSQRRGNCLVASIVLLLVAAVNIGFLAFIIWLGVSIAKAVWQ
jgi:hypothetical protein